MSRTADKRTYPTWRRDLNDIVRDESGKISGMKIGAIAGQWIAAKYLLVHWDKVITSWENMTVLFLILMAPQIFLKFANLKYSGSSDGSTTTTTASADVVTTTKGKR